MDEGPCGVLALSVMRCLVLVADFFPRSYVALPSHLPLYQFWSTGGLKQVTPHQDDLAM